ncbi:hypothetical protein, partial [Bradyrhizobium brasilense]|uniref:hypothetical protein n=1 Tax=Bradyrhizobium brasilense TaxID=1419277 RepID=UPI001E382EBC
AARTAPAEPDGRRAMTALTRRRDRERQEYWHIFYGDIHVGMIAERSGIPASADRWGWILGFTPPPHCANRAQGTAADFETARAAFEAGWLNFLPGCTEDDFRAYLRQQAFTNWKYTMWQRGCRLPTQNESGRSTCFCGAPLDAASFTAHV